MSTIYLYVRKTGCIGTLVTEMTRKEAIDIMREFRKSKYQVGILSGKNIKSLEKVYGEFAPFKVESREHIITVLQDEIEDEFLERFKRENNVNNIANLAKSILSKYKVISYEEEISEKELSLLSEIPYTQMAKRGYVETIRKNDLQSKKDKIINLRKYNNTNNLLNITDMRVACRKKETGNMSMYSLACWLKAGEDKAKNIKTRDFDKETLKSLIPRLRSMTFKKQNEFHNELVDLLASCGIALILEPKLDNINVLGATQWVEDDNKAIIQLTLKGKRSDSFWFTLFHEIAHIIIHDSKDFHIQSEDNIELEDEADVAARNWLIPDESYLSFKEKSVLSIDNIRRFSKSIDIHESIVIGRLQHEKELKWESNYNKYIPKVDII